MHECRCFPDGRGFIQVSGGLLDFVEAVLTVIFAGATLALPNGVSLDPKLAPDEARANLLSYLVAWDSAARLRVSELSKRVKNSKSSRSDLDSRADIRRCLEIADELILSLPETDIVAMLCGVTVNSSLGEIYIGAAIGEWSERHVLDHVHAALVAADKAFIILANFQIGGRQIDCVVVTDVRVVVIEVKASAMPVRGQLDGDWMRLDASGEWRLYTNGYRQALGQKERLRDAMRKRGNVGHFYPDAAVVFARPLPLGSDLTSGDFKVAVMELVRFLPTGTGRRPNPWSLDDWRTFASSVPLRRATVDEVQGGTAFEPSFELLRDYRDRIASELEREGNAWLPETGEQRDELVAAAKGTPGLYVQGPSGCGKTMIARWIGGRLSRAGECVLFVAGKNFDGSWARLLKRELALVTGASLADLFGAIRETGTPVLIILDGANELGARREDGLRGLRSIARKLDARVIVTGQSAPAEQLAGLTSIAVGPPSTELKEQIAAKEQVTLSASMRAVLKAVTSGFEAAIVAEIGADASPDASRQLLVDQFIRRRLGSARTSGSAGLRRFAQTLIETTSFSLNETVFDELMRVNAVSDEAIDALFAARALVRRGGRVSFAHEILLNSCAAFAYAQLAPEAGAKFAILLSLPPIEPIAADIVSVLEDPLIVREVLRSTTNHALLHDSAQGLAGPIAAAAAEKLFEEIEAAILNEIAGLVLTIVTDPRPTIDWNSETLRAWSDAEGARIDALARVVAGGHRVDQYFALCAAMDARLWEERSRLFDDAQAAGIHGLRSEGFSLAYFGFGRQSGFTKLTRAFESSAFDLFDSARAHAPRDMLTLTSGQLHFYLERRRIFTAGAGVNDMAESLAAIIEQRFRWEPYHVKLAILHAAGFVRWASDAQLEKLAEAIEGIDANREHLFVSSAIVDALRFLGRLDDSAEGARESIKGEVDRATAEVEDEDEDTLATALGVYVAAFDHPYSSVYAEELYELPEPRRHRLIHRALRAKGARTSMSLGWLMRELAAFEDPSDAPIMADFSRLPDPRNGFPQGEWAAFATATRFLGRHELALPPLSGASESANALIHIRALVYAADGGARLSPPEPSWAALQAMKSGLVIGCLAEMEAALREHVWLKESSPPRLSLVSAYKSESLAAARRFLDEGAEEEHFHFAYGMDRGPTLAIAIVEQFGDRSDLERLRRLTIGSRVSRQALDALRKLDAA
jgi:hypothetical protein